MIGAGELRSRLTLQAPVQTADGQGGVTRSYAAQGAVWAKVETLTSRENVSADADGGTLRVRITTRAPLTLSLQHRFVDGGKIYRITSYRDDGRLVVIDAELRWGDKPSSPGACAIAHEDRATQYTRRLRLLVPRSRAQERAWRG